MRALLNLTAETAARYLENLEDRSVAPSPAALRGLTELDEPLPERPMEAGCVLETLDRIGSPATMGMAGRRYFGFVIGGSLPAALASNWLAGAWDQCPGLFAASPVGTVLEEVSLGWLLDVLKLPASSGGAFVTGATVANFTALAAARHAVLARAGWDVEADGLFGAPPITVVVGDEAHPSLIKALGMLGLGRSRVMRVPVDGFLLALAIFGVAWYVYPRLRSQTEANTQIKSVQTAVDGLGDRMKAAESKFESQSNEQQDLHNQVTNLGRRLSARIENARREVQQSSAEMFRQAQTRIDDQIRGVQARMTRLESSSSDANTQVAELRRELGQVRGEMAQQGDQLRDELRAVRRDMRNDAVTLQMANLKSSEERDRKDVNSLIDALNLRRVAFEVKKNRDQELAPGVSLNVTGTDIAHRRVSGWMWLMPDRRTLWLHSQTAQEPVIFYGYQDGKRRELVITNVTNNGATGYLLLPKVGNSTQVAGLQQGQ